MEKPYQVNMSFLGDSEEGRTASSCSTIEVSNGLNSKGEIETCRSSNKKVGAKAVVTVRNGVKRYGSAPLVLNNFNMTVQKGTIYSLLGSSGCGKTTLLACLVGIRHLNSGQVLLFGKEPGTEGCGVPGRRVGYMPQETSLYNNFSIEETIRYFGTLYGMPNSEIQTSLEFLVTMLDLPDLSKRVGILSGGQKRRVSLALSLIHSPELLILDEPTVGVDPLLRESIWNHLIKLTSNHNTTVIITTHYIEEAKNSNTIGLMRGGRLLTEKSPMTLLEEHNTTVLEEVVLKLCKGDVFVNDHINTSDTYEEPDVVCQEINDLDENKKLNEDDYKSRRMSMVQESVSFKDSSALNRVSALVKKNFVNMRRNWPFLVFMLWVPAFQVYVMGSAIGNDPKPLHVGFVNHEIPYNESCPYPWIPKEGCDVHNLACQFMSKLPSDVVLSKYKTEDEAREDVSTGNIWAFMSFPTEFSENVYSRAVEGSTIENDTLEGSQISVQMDISNKQIGLNIKRIIFDAYKEFTQELLVGCGFNPQLAELPIKYLDPVYGTDDTDFTEYVSPGILISMMYFFPLCSSGVTFIMDKKGGTLERTLVTGARTWEIMLAFFISEASGLLIQACLSFMVVLGIFGIGIRGSLILAVALTVLMGLEGVSLGFLIASFCNEEVEVALLAVGNFFPFFALAGIVWPVAGMARAIQYLSYFLPLTLPSESIRSIISRGWGFSHFNVWSGFAAILFYIALYWIITIVIYKRASKRK